MKKKDEISFSGLSDVGKQRTNNEDAFVVERLDEHSVLAIVIDGVGGYEGGEVAAKIAQIEIPKYLRDFRNGERLELLKQAVVNANNAIYAKRLEDPEHASMSCVLTSAIVDTKKQLIDMVHVGDTRLYQYCNNQLTKLSHDHSLIGYREEKGDLTEEQAMHHPQRNVISRDVGSALHEIDDRDFLESAEMPLLPNSTLLLCSDGLTDLITSAQIVSILEQKKTINEKARTLINAANNAGGKDNVTVVLVKTPVSKKTPQPIQQTSTAQNDCPVNESTTTDKHKKFLLKGLNRHWWLIMITLGALLLSIFAISYAYRAHKETLELKNVLENHLQYSEINSESEMIENANDSIPKTPI